MFESKNAARSLSPRLQGLVEGELADGEELIWVAQPNPRRFALKYIPTALIGITVIALALFWIAGAPGFKVPDFSKEADFVMFFLIPCVLFGLLMLSAPFGAIYVAKRTAYLITDRRAVIFNGGWGTKIRSFGPEDLQDPERRQRRDGSGDIVLTREVSYIDRGRRHSENIGFFAIPDVKEVEQLLEEIAKQNRRE